MYDIPSLSSEYLLDGYAFWADFAKYRNKEKLYHTGDIW